MKSIALTLALLLGTMTFAQAEEKVTVETDAPATVEVDVKEDAKAPAMEETAPADHHKK